MMAWLRFLFMAAGSIGSPCFVGHRNLVSRALNLQVSHTAGKTIDATF